MTTETTIDDRKTGGDAGQDAPDSYRLSRQIAVLADPNAPEAESIDALRTYLLSQHLEAGRRSLAICAPSDGTGVTHIAVSLAASFAQAGVDTLLIDADLRSAPVNDFITPARPATGLRQLLEDESLQLTDAIRADVLPSLSVLFAGGATANSQQLLAKKSFRTIMDAAIRTHEMTIVTAPPSNLSADALRIGAACHYAVVVACRNVSQVNDVQTLVKDLQANRVTVAGTYLNEF